LLEKFNEQMNNEPENKMLQDDLALKPFPFTDKICPSEF